jgi:hypothetical protein
VSLLQQRLAAITDTAANLKAQLFELERLREQIRKALLSAENSRTETAERTLRYPAGNRP